MTNEIRPTVFLAAVFAAVCAAVLCVALLAPRDAYANPTAYAPTAQTSSATTTPTYMTAGTATTTVVYDSYAILGTNQSGVHNTFAANFLALGVQFAGSSTAAVVNIDIEYSNDCKDYYALALGSNAAASSVASSSPNIGAYMTFTFPYASSTNARVLPAVIGQGNATTSNRIINVPAFTRCVRAIGYLPAGSTNGALWLQWIPRKENP